MGSKWGLQKLLRGLVSHELKTYLSVFDLLLTNEMVILSKDVNQTALRKQITLQIFEVFVQILLNVNLSLNQTLLTFLHQLNDFIDSGNFSVMGYLPLIWKDSVTHLHGLAVYVKEGLLPFTQELSLDKSADSFLCFRLALLHSGSYFFLLYQSLFSTLCTTFWSYSL